MLERSNVYSQENTNRFLNSSSSLPIKIPFSNEVILFLYKNIFCSFGFFLATQLIKL